jgi:hypothetical protein
MNVDSVGSVVYVLVASIFSVTVNGHSLLELYVLHYVLYKKEKLFKLSVPFSQWRAFTFTDKIVKNFFPNKFRDIQGIGYSSR